MLVRTFRQVKHSTGSVATYCETLSYYVSFAGVQKGDCPEKGMTMGLEDILVRVLNRRRRRPAARLGGFYLGQARNLIGGDNVSCSVPVAPPTHSIFLGRSGAGKTTALLRLMAEHIKLAIPFLFVDFHGQATDVILSMIAGRGQKNRVVLLEPWSDPVVGWNPLAVDHGSPYAIVQELVSIFHHRLWSDSWGPRLEECLRNSLLALAEAKLTLLEAVAFLSHPEFRRLVLQKVSIREVRDYWMLRFERLSPSQRSLVAETVLNKISIFHVPALKYIVGQRCGTLDFDRALENRRHHHCQPLDRKHARKQLPASRFTRCQAQEQRLSPTAGAKPYSVILDEFHELTAVEALDDYLRSFRKFQCSVFLATQHLQLAPEIKAAVFGNCSRFFCFASSGNDAAFLGREFGPPEGDLVAEMLPELSTGRAVAKFRGEPARLLRVVAPDVKVTEDRAAAGRAKCLQLGMSRHEIDAEIDERRSRFAAPGNLKVRGTHKEATFSEEHSEPRELKEGYEGF